MGFCVCSMFYCALFCVLSSFAIILMEMRQLAALLCLYSWCLAIVVVLRIFLMVPLVDLQYEIVAFPDHTHLLFKLQLHTTKHLKFVLL